MAYLPSSDQTPATQNITVVDSASTSTASANNQVLVTGTATVGSVASFSLSTIETVRVEVSGTWTGTLSSEISIDGGTTWASQGLHQGAYTISTFSGNFVGGGSVTGATNFRMRATATITGTATVKIISSLNTNSVYIANAAPSGNIVSVLNSSVATLTSGSTFTGTGEDTSNFSEIRVSVISNVASASNGLSMQQSSDNTNWDITDTYTIAANTGATFTVPRQARWFRVVYTNGGTNQTSFRLQTILNRTGTAPSSNRAGDAYTNETDLEQNQSFLMGYNGTTWDRLRTTGTGVLSSSAAQGTAAALTAGWPTINGEATDVTGTFTNATQTTSVTASNLDGYGNTLISINGTYGTATAVFEGSDDSGTTWYIIQAARDNTNVIETGYTSQTNTSQTWQINNPGLDSIRVRSTAVASGTVNVRLSSSAAPVASGTIVGIGTPIPAGTNVIGHVIADIGSTTAITDGTNPASVVVGDTGFNGIAIASGSKQYSFTTSASGAQNIGQWNVEGYSWIEVTYTSVGVGLALTGQFAPNIGGTYANFTTWGNTNGGSTAPNAVLAASVGITSWGPVKGNYFQLALSALTSGTFSGNITLRATAPPSTGAVAATQSGTWNLGGATSAAMADGFANPTNNSVASFGGVYNGTNWDRIRSGTSAKGTTGTGLLGTAILGFDGTNYQAVSTSTAGVQYVLQRADTSTLTNVASSATSVIILATNTARKGASVYNDSTQILYLKFGTTASTTSFTVPLAAAAFFEVPSGYTGEMDGIWTSANGNARVTEIT